MAANPTEWEIDPMRVESTRDGLGLLFLVVQLVMTPFLVPAWTLGQLGTPVYVATVASILTSLFLLVLRAFGERGSALERRALALFLAGMPVIYVASWALEPAPGWLTIELVGVVVFVALAYLGWTRSIWFLAAGIAGHGVFWDAWHHGRTPFVPDWYALGCFLVDVGIGAYVACEAPRFERPRPSVAILPEQIESGAQRADLGAK
jgi:hypothetical protein